MGGNSIIQCGDNYYDDKGNCANTTFVAIDYEPNETDDNEYQYANVSIQ